MLRRILAFATATLCVLSLSIGIAAQTPPAGKKEHAFKGKIEKAIKKVGLTEFSWVENEVLNGRALLWLAYEDPTVYAAAVTALVNGVCEIVACGGEDLEKFLPLLKDLEEFARAEKCRAMRIYGRKGWIRVLKNYQLKAIVLERPL